MESWKKKNIDFKTSKSPWVKNEMEQKLNGNFFPCFVFGDMRHKHFNELFPMKWIPPQSVHSPAIQNFSLFCLSEKCQKKKKFHNIKSFSIKKYHFPKVFLHFLVLPVLLLLLISWEPSVKHFQISIIKPYNVALRLCNEKKISSQENIAQIL